MIILAIKKKHSRLFECSAPTNVTQKGIFTFVQFLSKGDFPPYTKLEAELEDNQSMASFTSETSVNVIKQQIL